MSKRSCQLNAVGTGLVGVLLWALHLQACAQANTPLTPALGQLSQTNPFDAERKLWPDRTPPPPPPPVPAPVTDADLEVYGVVMAGGAQKALLKLGKRFEGVPAGSNGISVVPVGARLGEFVLSQLKPDQILLKAPGGEQWIRFSVKKDRSGGPVANQTAAAQPAATFQPPAQVPTFGGAGMPPPAGAPFGLTSGASGAVSTGGAPGGVPIAPVGGAQAAQEATSPPAVQPGSLAAAIFAAQAAQKAAADGSAPATSAPGVNPFEALFQQQKK